MGILARILIAVAVCPGLGAVVGQDLATAAAGAARLDPGAVVRWEMTGLLAGVTLGFVFAVMAIACTVGFGGRLRGRVADPVVLSLGLLAVGALLVRRSPVGPSAAHALRTATVVAWLLGFLVMVRGILCRPRPVTWEEEPGLEPPEEPHPAPDGQLVLEEYSSEEESDV